MAGFPGNLKSIVIIPDYFLSFTEQITLVPFPLAVFAFSLVFLGFMRPLAAFCRFLFCFLFFHLRGFRGAFLFCVGTDQDFC